MMIIIADMVFKSTPSDVPIWTAVAMTFGLDLSSACDGFCLVLAVIA